MIRLSGKEGAIGLITALLASSCCLLPLAVVFFGLGSGAFMMTTMRYRPVLFPLGLLGLGVSYYLYVRERRRCQTEACAMVGNTFNIITLALATLIMVGVIWADFFASM
jgi:mercuric ion transport protein